MSWISIHDLLDVVHFVVTTPGLSGPINVASPHPVTNDEFTHTLGRVLRRPTLFPVLHERTIRAAAPRIALEDPDGTLHQFNTDACCAVRKVEPLDRALAAVSRVVRARVAAEVAELQAGHGITPGLSGSSE